MTMFAALKGLVIPPLNTGTAPGRVVPRPLLARVPRIIHQTFPSRQLPEALADNVAATRASNPDWEYRLHDDHDVGAFITDRYGAGMRRDFDRINPAYGAARADLFRYLLLYDVGGVYLDIKAGVRRPLSGVIRDDDQFLISQWPTVTTGRFRGWGLYPELAAIPRGEFQQWCIVAAPGHPFLRAAIDRVLANLDRYVPSVHGVGRWPVLRVTGPIAYTLAIAPLLAAHPHRVVESEAELGLQYSIFDTGRDHMQLFKTHYGTRTDSIVSLGARQRLLDALVRAARRLRAAGRPASA